MSDRSYTPDVIAEAIRGDDAALSFLYESTQGKVTQTVRSMIRDEDAVLDIVQDSYIKAFRNLDKLDRPDRFPLWIRRIASNTAVDYLKKKRPMLFSELVAEDGSEIEFEDVTIGHMPEAQLDQKETSRLIREIISGLSEEQQLVIGLFYFEEVPIKAIARKLGCSENTVKSRLNYGRKNIEKQVRELEKKGTKLYSLAPLPFFLWLLRNLHTAAPQGTLGTVLVQCGSVSSGAASTAGGAVAQAGGRIVKKAAEKAGKKIAMKIAAAVLAVTVVGGGTVVALSGGSEKPAPDQEIGISATELQQGGETVETTIPPTQPPDAPTAAYQEVLDEIRKASRHPFDTNNEYYYHFHNGIDLYYSRIDMDGNGVDELLIGRPGDIMDLFTFDGEKAVWVMNRFPAHVSSQLTLMETGELYLEAPMGTSTQYYMLRVAEDGYSAESVFNYVEYYDEEGIYKPTYDDTKPTLTKVEFQQLLDGYTPVTDIQWIQFAGPTEDMIVVYEPILQEYSSACADRDYLDHRENYPNTINDGMYYYHAFGPSDLYFAFHDIDGNGMYELLIGDRTNIWDVYGIENGKPVKLVDIRALGGGRTALTVMESGELYVSGASGADNVTYEMLRIGDDGFSAELVFYFTSEEYSTYQGVDGSKEVVLTQEEFEEKLGAYTEAYINWELLVEAPMTWREAYQVILDEYTTAAEAVENGTYSADLYPHTNNGAMRNAHNGARVHFLYAFYDVDKNGTDELIISCAYEHHFEYSDGDPSDSQIIDVYTYDGFRTVQLFHEPSLGDTAHLRIEGDGRMYLTDESQPEGREICVRIAADGYSPETVYSYNIRKDGNQIIYYNSMETLDDFEIWQKWCMSYFGVSDFGWTQFASYNK